MELAAKNILVVGGAGFIGSHLVDVLDDCQVRVLDDLSSGTRDNLAQYQDDQRVELMVGDIRDGDTVAAACEGIDVIFHLACRGVRHSIAKPFENHDVNATGTLHLLQEARRRKIQRFIHISTSEVYGTARYAPMDENHPTIPETVYGAAKLAGECYARAFHQTYQFPSVVVRPFNNFGPRSHHEGDSGEVIPRFVVWALSGKPPIVFGDGKQTRDFIYVRDTAMWLRKIAQNDAVVGQTINLGSGRETSVLELAQLVYQLAEVPPIEPQFEPPRPGDVRRHLADTTLAQELMQFQPHMSLADGIGKLIQYTRQHPKGVEHLLEGIPAINW